MAASGADEPSYTSATYSDWKVECRSAPAAKTKGKKGKTAKGTTTRVCEMIQLYNFRRTRRRIAKLAIGKLPGQEKVKAVVESPLNVYLPDGVTIKTDSKAEFKGVFIRCKATSCFANFDLNKDAISKLEFAKKATMTFTNLARRKIVLPVSLKGFSSAYTKAVVAQGR